jgi:hypothetical protein
VAAVYSRKLFTYPSASGGPFLAYTAPEFFVTVVRTISIVWGDVAVSGLDAWVQVADGTKLVRRTLQSVPDPDPMYVGGCAVYDGRWVLDAFDTLSVQTASGTADFAAGGYALSLP